MRTGHSVKQRTWGKVHAGVVSRASGPTCHDSWPLSVRGWAPGSGWLYAGGLNLLESSTLPICVKSMCTFTLFADWIHRTKWYLARQGWCEFDHLGQDVPASLKVSDCPHCPWVSPYKQLPHSQGHQNAMKCNDGALTPIKWSNYIFFLQAMLLSSRLLQYLLLLYETRMDVWQVLKPWRLQHTHHVKILHGG